MRIETLAVHAGHSPDRVAGAITPPIHLSTTFERAADGTFPSGFLYGRYGNPNRVMLEECLAALEGGEAAAAFASGTAAAAAIARTLLPGDHVVVPIDVYRGSAQLFFDMMTPWGLEVTGVDMRDLAAVEAAMRETTRLVWVETPSNPLLALTDIAAVAAIAHDGDALVVCDNTWATPVLTRPFEHGADVVLHSTTKYLGGHSDVIGGAVVVREAGTFLERLRAVQVKEGAVPSPFDCWLVLRGIRTLPWRMRAACESAGRIAAFLATHPGVESVHYPGLALDAGFELARRQMAAPGAMLAFLVAGGRAGAFELCARLALFTRATSLGGTESLIEHRASIEGAGSRAPENLLRISVGLEHPDDLLADLDRALAR